ncbi:PIR Superfamily Protein [Plasmodium ovale curtisi]|uniref:PIR Superfamily Protein n=1 Tax=Plasmodium ovale curtisi TaxID=864141 RepID=A0A1A8XAV3_PLAOA|nr:PIR Superfamily Protein [Plasmodium ovale curtisi]
MPTSNTSNCELPSDKYYGDLDNVTNAENFKHYCDSDEKLHNKCHELKDFCWKWESNLKMLTQKNSSNFNMEKHCTYLNLWLQYNVINTVESKNFIVCITYLYSIWENIKENLEDSVKKSCVMKFPPVSTGYREKFKKMHDYNNNYEEVKNTFQNKKDSKENCIEDYCKYIADIINIYNEFKHVCNGKNNERCPEYWNNFEQNYPVASHIEKQCKEIYEKLGLYKIKFYFGEQDIEEYIEQYESEHTFTFFEKLIGYSIKYYLSKTIHYSKYILLPIILILLFYFFMKKLSLFGSKIAPKADDMRKMWRNVQGVTNPASLLNPMKPPGGGNKIGLPFLPK